ncbi:MAG TPA: septum site-determining protein MinD, partial [Paenalcaligenes hominis]|nr:septum site-determining protein MinD [Paenalcaligenes hominis]
VLNDLKEMEFEYIVCDSPAGIETGALMAAYFADDAIVVTNPEVSSVRDSDRILGILSAKSQRAEKADTPINEYLLISRYSAKRVADGEMLSLQDIEDILRIKLIGVVPESEDVLHASNQGTPVIHLNNTPAAQAYEDVVARYLGEERPLRFVDYEKPGFLKRLFGGK